MSGIGIKLPSPSEATGNEAAIAAQAEALAGQVASVNGRTGAVTLAASDVGLGNANNTSDANKPVSTATTTAIAAEATARNTAIATAAPAAGTPSGSTDTGTSGKIKYDSGFLYLCVATDTWLRFIPDATFV